MIIAVIVIVVLALVLFAERSDNKSQQTLCKNAQEERDRARNEYAKLALLVSKKLDGKLAEAKLALERERAAVTATKRTLEEQRQREREELAKTVNALERERADVAAEKRAFENNMARERQKLIDAANEEVETIRDAVLKEGEIAKRGLEALEKHDENLTIRWIAKEFSEFFGVASNEIAHLLEVKRPPAVTSAERVRIEGAKRREAVRDAREWRLRCEYYEMLFPFLEEIVGNDDPLTEQEVWDGEEPWEKQDDESARWLTKKEFEELSSAQKGQRALDRWMKRRKTRGEIGAEYEDYIGYIYEHEGWHVDYHGMEKKKEDMGRDLICRKDGQILIVQCKRWSQEKVLHEKHIAQLLGTTLEYALQHDCRMRHLGLGGDKNRLSIDFSDEAVPVFVTTGELSPTAKKFASTLGVELRTVPIDELFPRIKCNIAGDGERIYHLPFDQQYPRVKLTKRGELRVCTVKEAEALGFRRAMRHVASVGR